MEQDLVDRLTDQWEDEMPDFDLSGMQVVGRLVWLGRQLEIRIEDRLREFGLIYTDFDILATLRRSGHPYSLTPTQLLESVLLTSGAMTAAMKRLEKSGLIRRAQSEEDRRSFSAQLTPAGVALTEKSAKIRFEDANDLVRAFPQKDVEALIPLLRRLCIHLPGISADQDTQNIKMTTAAK